MKKFLFISFFLVVSLAVVLQVPHILSSEYVQASVINPFENDPNMQSPITTVGDQNSGVIGLIVIVIKWMYTLFFIVAVAMILLAAYNFVRGGSNEKLVETAKKQLKWAVVAIAVALVATGISMVVQDFLVTGGESSQPQNPTLPPLITT
ncbi:MAG: hypothetical protein WC099_03340 [Candidatus Paceibacterota bacterium]